MLNNIFIITYKLLNLKGGFLFFSGNKLILKWVIDASLIKNVGLGQGTQNIFKKI